MTDEVDNIDIDQARDLVSQGATLLDVREEDEWLAGHAPSAVHIRLSDLPDRLAELPTNETIVCVCRSGGRSARAANFLNQQGFAALNLSGGMQGWAAHGEPMESENGSPTVI